MYVIQVYKNKFDYFPKLNKIDNSGVWCCDPSHKIASTDKSTRLWVFTVRQVFQVKDKECLDDNNKYVYDEGHKCDSSFKTVSSITSGLYWAFELGPGSLS